MSFMFPGFGGMGGGGMPGGFGGMGGGAQDSGSDDGPSTDSNKYYELLNIDKKATPQQIKKAYRKLARELHPDKHPGKESVFQAKFQEMQAAYEVLSDPSKRKMYDRYGEAGLKGHGSGGGMSDIFDMFFSGHGGHGHGGGGGGGRGRAQQRRRKAPAIRAFVDVTLRDLYIGASKEIENERMTVCKDCAGKGGKKIVECGGCHGTGRQVVVQRMGYMTMQTQRECPQCSGEGNIIPDRDRCKKCKGKGMKSENCTLSFDIPRGSKHADKIVLHAQGHEIPDAANGDVVVILRCTKHSVFSRVGADLAMTYNITLKQALCGYNIVIPHLSGSKLRLKSKPGEIVKHGQLKAIYTKGMPQKGSNVYGHLYVKFEIKFPVNGSMDEETIALISNLLPKGPNEESDSPEAMDDESEHKRDDGNSNNNNNEEEPFDEEDGLVENVEDYELHEEAEDVEGEPTVTPASSRSAYDEDEDNEGGVNGCRQM